MEDNTKITLNKEQKPWAVVLYDEDGTDYVFMDDHEEADAKCDAMVAAGYSAEVVNCKSAARRQAIEWVNDKIKSCRCADQWSLNKYYEHFIKSGHPLYQLTDADKRYVLSVVATSIEDAENDENNEREDGDEIREVEIDDSDFNVRLHIATKVMEACLEKSDIADLCDIAKSLEDDGYGVNLVNEYKEVQTIRINRFAAAMAKSLYHAVLDSFNEEED